MATQLELIAQALANTIDPAMRQQAETFLEQAYKVPAFTPCLLQIVMNGGIPLETRQAGAIYLKNTIQKYWKERTAGEGEEAIYCIPQQAKEIARANIVEAIIQVPPRISRQLCVCLENIIKHDFPDHWTGVVEKCHGFLVSDNQVTWMGSLLSLYQLSKKYKFRKGDERTAYISAMQQLLPVLYTRMIEILPNQSEFSVGLQHWILKIFYTTIQYELPLELISGDSLPGWMIVFQTIVQRPVPLEVQAEDEEERPQQEWWKCKKWALHILCRLFERYGSPGDVEDSYNLFAAYYMKTFNKSVVLALLEQLQKIREGVYQAPRIKQLVFNYLIEAVGHAASWQLIKPHFQNIFQDIVFPLMCYSDEDDQLWKDDPYEYIRMKFDIFEDLVSPVVAAQAFLHTACQKRKNILDPVMAFCVRILEQPPAERDPRKKDGALHVIGSTSEILIKKKLYKQQLESMLVVHVFSEFRSPLGYMRARACWMLNYFSEINFSDQMNLTKGLQEVLNCLTADKELPVKVEAAICLQSLIKNQTMAVTLVEPHVRPIIQVLLELIQETENDDLTSVLQDLIEVYSQHITDVAVELCSTLGTTFSSLLDASGEEDGYKALTALGLLSAVQTLVKSAFGQPEMLQQMEKTLTNTIAFIFQNGIMDYYEEMLTLIDLFTVERISPDMWQMLGIMYEAFNRDGYDYFNEIMSAVYNYIRVDSDAFGANSRCIEPLITMTKAVLTGDLGEEPQMHACKLLEVLLIECKGKIDQYIPNILEVVLERLTRQFASSDLRCSCVLVVIAGIFYNSNLVIDLLDKTRFPDHPDAITDQFFTCWMSDSKLFEGIHDRKMSTLGLCCVMQCPLRPMAVQSKAGLIVPTIIHLLEMLVKAYRKEAEEEHAEDDEEEDTDGDEEEEEELGDEEDVKEGRNTLLKKITDNAAEEDEEEDDDPECLARTMMEIDYDTVVDDEDVVDEFCVFKDTLHAIELSNREWFALLTSGLTPELTQKTQQLFACAEQRRAAMESRQRKKQGGYSFTTSMMSVPQNFSFATS